jgi:transposase
MAKGHYKKYAWDGEMLTLAEIAERGNVSISTVKNWVRYVKAGRIMGMEGVRKLQAKRATKPVVWNGIYYHSTYLASKTLGISNYSMRRRIARGWTCDQDMIGVDIDESSPHRKGLVHWRGRTFDSYVEMAREYGIHYQTARAWVTGKAKPRAKARSAEETIKARRLDRKKAFVQKAQLLQAQILAMKK